MSELWHHPRHADTLHDAEKGVARAKAMSAEAEEFIVRLESANRDLKNDLLDANQVIVAAQAKMQVYEEKTRWLEGVAYDLRHKLASVLADRKVGQHAIQNGFVENGAEHGKPVQTMASVVHNVTAQALHEYGDASRLMSPR